MLEIIATLVLITIAIAIVWQGINVYFNRNRIKREERESDLASMARMGKWDARMEKLVATREQRKKVVANTRINKEQRASYTQSVRSGRDQSDPIMPMQTSAHLVSQLYAATTLNDLSDGGRDSSSYSSSSSYDSSCSSDSGSSSDSSGGSSD